MKITDLFEEVTTPVTPQMTNNFNSLFQRIQSRVKQETGINVTQRWVAGLMNQSKNYKHLDQIFNNQIKAGNSDAANDTHARIIARDVLTAAGLFNKANGYTPVKPKLLSAMRQVYSDTARTETNADDMAKHTREANAKEYDEWLASLDDTQKNYVKNLQELDADELAGFKGIITAKQHKKEFVTRMYQWSQGNEVALNILQQMDMVTPQGKLNTNNIENLREFLNSVSDARLKDIMSKNTVYAGKSIVHAQHRSANKVLKDIEHDPQGKQGLTLKLYHYISKKVADKTDKDRAFRRMLEKIPLGNNSEGQLSDIGKGAYTLYKDFGGKKLDPTQAIAALNQRYEEPADLEKRAQKAAGRGDSLRNVSDI